jgi:hypothetical protein
MDETFQKMSPATGGAYELFTGKRRKESGEGYFFAFPWVHSPSFRMDLPDE